MDENFQDQLLKSTRYVTIGVGWRKNFLEAGAHVASFFVLSIQIAKSFTYILNPFTYIFISIIFRWLIIKYIFSIELW